MADTVLVRPRHGLILAGIPRTGAAIPTALAEEWIADRLVERMPQSMTPAVVGQPTSSRKQGRTSGR